MDDVTEVDDVTGVDDVTKVDDVTEVGSQLAPVFGEVITGDPLSVGQPPASVVA